MGQRVLTAFLQAAGKPHQLFLAEPLGRNERGDPGLALGQGAGFVHHHGIHLFHALQGFRIADENTALGASPDTDHDGHGRCQPQRTRAGDDQHAHRGDQAEGHGRCRAEQRPGEKGDEGDHDHGRHKVPRHLVGHPLDRCAAALGTGHHLHDLGQHGVLADLVGPHEKAALLVDAAADHMVAGFLADRQGLTGHHGFIHMGAAFKHLAVQRHLVSRANPQAIANLDLVQRDIGLAAVVIQFPGRRRGEVQESPDGAGGFLARPQLQHLSEQHQDHDDRCRLEIHGNRTTVLPEGIREDLRHQGGHQAVDQGDTGAEGNQREHVQMPTDHGFPGPDKEGPTAPEHDRRCQHQLNPVGQLRGHNVPEPGEMAAHFKHQDRQGQDQSDP